jgi:hypothetical protein
MKPPHPCIRPSYETKLSVVQTRNFQFTLKLTKQDTSVVARVHLNLMKQQKMRAKRSSLTSRVDDDGRTPSDASSIVGAYVVQVCVVTPIVYNSWLSCGWLVGNRRHNNIQRNLRTLHNQQIGIETDIDASNHCDSIGPRLAVLVVGAHKLQPANEREGKLVR